MPLLEISIKNFRNFGEIRWKPSPGLNVLEGENAQGKTNLLEAIYFLANGRSFRSADWQSLIRFGEAAARLQARLQHGELASQMEVRLSPEGKELRLNEKIQKRWNGVFSIFRVLIFTPDSTLLFRGNPGSRRRYFDGSITVHSTGYGALLSRYARVLRQRNQLLESRAPSSLREPFDRQWAQSAHAIMVERKNYLIQLLPLWQSRMDALTQSHAPLDARWEGRLRLEDCPEPEHLLAALEASGEEEGRLRQTVLGPNRDDLVATFGGKAVREVASQGQQRMLVIALKLAQADLFTHKTGHAPVFLLDDIGSELDAGHLKRLLQTLGELHAQTVLTSAAAGSFEGLAAETFVIQKGNLLSKSKG